MRCLFHGRDSAERFEHDPATRHNPGGDRSTVHQREGPGDAALGHDRLAAALDRRPVDPAVRQRVEPTEQLGTRSALRCIASDQVNQATGRSCRSVPAERSPRRASPRVMPSARPSQAGQLLTVHRCADWSRTSRANRPDDRPGLPYGADVQSRSGVHDLRLRGLSSPGWLRGGRRG